MPGYYEGSNGVPSSSAVHGEGGTTRVLRCGATREYLPPEAYIVRTEVRYTSGQGTHVCIGCASTLRGVGLPRCLYVCVQEEDAAAEAEALRDDEAMRSFRDKVQRLYPPAAGMPTLKVTTGTRVATKRR